MVFARLVSESGLELPVAGRAGSLGRAKFSSRARRSFKQSRVSELLVLHLPPPQLLPSLSSSPTLLTRPSPPATAAAG